jgi:hypothetical protein
MVERGDNGPRVGSRERRSQGSDPEGAESVLVDLVEVERRVRETLEQAQAEAERAIAEVKSEIDQRAQTDDDELETALRELEAGLRAEQATTLAEIRRRGDQAARRHREIDESTVEGLAAEIARRVAEGETPDDEAGR